MTCVFFFHLLISNKSPRYRALKARRGKQIELSHFLLVRLCRAMDLWHLGQNPRRVIAAVVLHCLVFLRLHRMILTFCCSTLSDCSNLAHMYLKMILCCPTYYTAIRSGLGDTSADRLGAHTEDPKHHWHPSGAELFRTQRLQKWDFPKSIWGCIRGPLFQEPPKSFQSQICLDHC